MSRRPYRSRRHRRGRPCAARRSQRRYGYWIDELYFIACGEHLAWGYVDHPPLVAVVAKFSRLLLGGSLLALRLLPAVSTALLVLLTGWMARAFGGGRAALVIAAVAAFVVPAYAVFGSVLTTSSFEPLFWTSCACLTIRMAQGTSPRLWLALGAVAGVGLLNKHSMAFFAAALVAGLLLSPQRRLLWNRCFWFAGLVTVLIATPHLLWQMTHGWPTVELLANAHRYQHQPVTPLEFVWGQIQIIHPFLFPVWIAGLYFFLADARGARFRFLGWTFVVLFLTFLSVQAKTYYLAPIYPMLLAAGGVVIEQATPKARRVWVTSGVVNILLLGSVATAPYVLPILPIHLLPRYMEMLGLKEVRPERRPMGNVPQIFADMLGSEQLVAEVARVYAGLTPDERHHAVLWGRDFGVAGAIDYFGRACGHRGPQPGVGSEHAVVTVAVDAWRRDQHHEPVDQLERIEKDGSGRVRPRFWQLVDHAAGSLLPAQPLAREKRPRDEPGRGRGRGARGRGYRPPGRSGGAPMRGLGFVLAACAALGLAGCFLPLLRGEHAAVYWSLRDVDPGHTYAILLAYIAAFAGGIAAVARLAHTYHGLARELATGGRFLAGVALAGLIVALLALARSREQRAAG